MSRSLISRTAALGVSILSVSVLTSPAEAAAPAATCASGYFCFFSGTNYTGNSLTISSSDAHLSSDLNPIKSWINATSVRWAFYSGTNYSGTQTTLVCPGNRTADGTVGGRTSYGSAKKGTGPC